MTGGWAVPGGRRLAVAALAVGVAAGAHAAEPIARLGPIGVLDDGRTRLLLGVGVWDAFAESSTNAEGRRSVVANAGLRLGWKLYGFGPMIGLAANLHGGVHGYAGAYTDFGIAGLVVTPLLAAGIYRQGDSKDLGGPFAFRYEIGVARELSNGARLGVTWGHASNAYLYDDNPSQEEYLLTYAWPF